MRIVLGVGIGGGGKPVPGSLARYISGPTISEIDQDWDVVWGAEQVIIISYPSVLAPTATFGGEEIIITG